MDGPVGQRAHHVERQDQGPASQATSQPPDPSSSVRASPPDRGSSSSTRAAAARAGAGAGDLVRDTVSEYTRAYRGA